MPAFFSELEKISATQSRIGQWAAKTVGAPRSKLPGVQMPKAPTAPGKLSPKIVKPGAKYGKRQKYSQPNTETPPTTSPQQGAMARQLPPPNVVFGVR